MAKSSAGPSIASASGRLQLNRRDAALARIVATRYANGPCTCDRSIDGIALRGKLASGIPHSTIYWEMDGVFFDKSAADWMIALRFKRGAMN
jgi:hypothetical protein